MTIVSGCEFNPDKTLRQIANIILALKGSDDRIKRQRGRIFRTLMSGLERGRRFGDIIRCMVLTLKRGVADGKRFARWFQVLRKRIEHEFGFCLEYAMVLVDDGSRVHAHILFKVRSLVSGQFLGLRSGFIPFEWLRNAWFSITKHSYGVFIQKLENNPNRLAGYFVAQYFNGQSGKMRLCYSWGWVFRGFCSVWRNCFAHKYFFACSALLSESELAKAKNVDNALLIKRQSLKAQVVASWHRVLGMDWFRLVRLFPFLKPV
jgi:hypothetical protein